MEFPTEYTGLGRSRPHSLKSEMPLSEATFVIKTRAPGGSPIQAVFWNGSKVKLKKLTLIMNPLGTVIFQVQSLFAGKLLGKFGLENNPLDPVRKAPGGSHAWKKRKYRVRCNLPDPVADVCCNLHSSWQVLSMNLAPIHLIMKSNITSSP